MGLLDRDYMAPRGTKKREEWESRLSMRPGIYARLFFRGFGSKLVGPFGSKEELLRWYNGNWDCRDVRKVVVEEVS